MADDYDGVVGRCWWLCISLSRALDRHKAIGELRGAFRFYFCFLSFKALHCWIGRRVDEPNGGEAGFSWQLIFVDYEGSLVERVHNHAIHSVA